MKTYIFFFLPFFGLCLAGCVEPYNFKSEARESFLVVDGRITQFEKYNTLRLTWSTPYGQATELSPVENGLVKIYKNEEAGIECKNLGDGFYQLTNIGEVGHTYYIEITIGEKKYRSLPETLPPPVMPDELSLKIGYKSEENEDGVLVTFPNIDVIINTPINNEQTVSYLRWKTEEDFSFFEIPCGPLHNPKGCFVHRETNPDNIIIFSGERLGKGYLQQQLVASKRIDDRSQFLFKHYFSVYQYAMTKKAYDFWEKIKLTSSPNGNIFDTPPATVHGNIYNIEDEDELVGGYFEASSVNVIRKYLTPSDMSPIIIDQIYNYCNTGICCNCMIIYNATTEAPDFWE